MIDIVWFLIVVGVIIFVHELGHFLAAKSVGMRVEKFSLGFPPKIKSYHYKGTDYTISAIPLGGYVKISGMIDESLDGSGLTGAPWEFQSKKTWQKIYVLCAGVLMITMINGFPEEGPVLIGGVQEGYPAEEAGLLAGDVILSVDGDPVPTWLEFVDHIKVKAEVPVNLTWISGIDTVSALVTPTSNDRILLGITRETAMQLAKDELGIETTERRIDRSEMYMADECFLTGTAAHVTPVVEIDNRLIGDGAIGKLTLELQNLYFDIECGRNKKYIQWCSPVYTNKSGG